MFYVLNIGENVMMVQDIFGDATIIVRANPGGRHKKGMLNLVWLHIKSMEARYSWYGAFQDTTIVLKNINDKI